MFFANAIFLQDEKGDLVQLTTKVADIADPLQPTDMGIALIKMLLSLIALAALLFGTYWFLRRLVQTRLQRGVGKQQTIELLEKKMISAKTMLYLIRVENKKILFAESHLEIKALESLPIQESLLDSSES
jgi:flagellar biogenesis protein FliO